MEWIERDERVDVRDMRGLGVVRVAGRLCVRCRESQSERRQQRTVEGRESGRLSSARTRVSRGNYSRLLGRRSGLEDRISRAAAPTSSRALRHRRRAVQRRARRIRL